MELKAAVEAAKAHVTSVFADDMLGGPQLEEVWFDDTGHVWNVTVGFYRKPDEVARAAGTFSRYTYKVVRVDEATGRPIAIRNREPVVAE
jgi:hypothetical protein